MKISPSKVYVAFLGFWEGDMILGIFTTKKKAREYIKQHRDREDLDIQEWVLNKGIT